MHEAQVSGLRNYVNRVSLTQIRRLQAEKLHLAEKIQSSDLGMSVRHPSGSSRQLEK